MSDFTFHKGERLKSTKVIARLFKEGHSFVAYPLRVVYLPLDSPQDFSARFALSVSKRNFSKAVQRNPLRRRIREAYRLHKHQLYQILERRNLQIAVMYIYIAKEPLPYQEIERGIKKSFKKLDRQISER